MPQKITVTGIPTTPLKMVKAFMGTEQNATKVYSFEMHESGSPNVAKCLPPGSKIEFTVFVNEKQLKKAGLDENNFMENKIMVQGDIIMDLSIDLCPGELGVTSNQLQIIPPKEKATGEAPKTV